MIRRTRVAVREDGRGGTCVLLGGKNAWRRDVYVLLSLGIEWEVQDVYV